MDTMDTDEREDPELTAEEARALAALASGPLPPARLEDETIAKLVAQGLLRGRRPSRLALIAAAASGIALFAAGLFVGERRISGGGPEGGARQYVLLLYDAPDEAVLTDAEMQARVSEYRAWAQGVRRAGGQIRGEKLESDGRWLGPTLAGAGSGHPLGGFFVFSAADDASAEAVARSCPHLRHGGTIEVRPVAKT